MMVVPAPGIAPVIPPVIAPIVQAKLLGAVAVNLIFGLVPLQIIAELAVKTTGSGFTVTVSVKGEPVHKPAVEVGVMI